MTTADGRYPWIFPVLDAFGRDAALRIGAERGQVIVDGPPWWTTDPDTADRIDLAVKAAANKARLQARS